MYLICVHGNKVDDITVLPFASSLKRDATLSRLSESHSGMGDQPVTSRISTLEVRYCGFKFIVVL